MTVFECETPIVGGLAPLVGDGVQTPTKNGVVAYANLDYAASAPALTSVNECIQEALPQYASVHRGAGYLSQLTTDRYEQAREVVARFVHARADDSVIFTRNTTDAINLLAHVVSSVSRHRATGRPVVVLDIEHHANLLPWQRIGARTVACRATLDDTLADLEAEIAAQPTDLLAITGASNVTGEVLPLARLAAIAHRHGARILVDAAQLAPHRPINLVSFGIDYLVFSGHKLYAPFGSGVLVGRGDWLDAAPPYLAGGGASAQVEQQGTAWHFGPARHEAGSPNVLGALSIAAACTELDALGFESIVGHERELNRALYAQLSVIDGVDPLRIWPDDALDCVGIVAFAVRGHSAREVAEYLSDHHGVGVRDGRFCAHLLVSRLGYPDGAVRASFGVGTSFADITRLCAALSELVAS